MNAPPKRPPVTENPWFWVHLFAVGALVALFLIGSKADDVQGQRDANFTRRQVSLERQAELRRSGAITQEDESEVAADTRYVDFTLFYTVFGLVAAGSWVMLWRQRFLQSSPSATVQ